MEQSREETLRFLKRLWRGEETRCIACGGANLTYLHKKAKKSDNDFICPACGKIYRTISMFMDLK